MHKDFHLYGTFLAAMLAGYKQDDAKEIAFAAQKVDEFGEDRSEACPTVTGMYGKPLKAFWGVYFRNQISQAVEISDTWMPFHFIPKHVIERRTTNISKAFACGCGEPMMKVCDAITPQKGERGSLERIGITMHVLADSFAHRRFSGVTCFNPRIIEQIQIRYKNHTDGLGMGHVPVWISGALSGIFYYGHGAAGHVPDLAWAEYSYCWKYDEKSSARRRNNPEEFAEAFKTMTDVLLKCNERTEYVTTLGFGIDDVGKWLGDTAEQIQRERSNTIDLNAAIEEARARVPEDIWEKQQYGFEMLTDEEARLLETIKKESIEFNQYNEAGSMFTITKTVGELLDKNIQSLPLEEKNDTTFAQFYTRCNQGIGFQWPEANQLNDEYLDYLSDRGRDDDFKKAAEGHKAAVYQAIGINWRILQQIIEEDYKNAIRPGSWIAKLKGLFGFEEMNAYE